MFFRKKSKFDATDSVLKRVNGKMIKYVSELDSDNVETIIGRNGRLIVTDKNISVKCGDNEVYSCPRKECSVYEMQSLAGVVIEGKNPDGTKRIVTAFYTYYNK